MIDQFQISVVSHVTFLVNYLAIEMTRFVVHSEENVQKPFSFIFYG